jgi:hypothetical protein
MMRPSFPPRVQKRADKAGEPDAAH